MLFVAPSVVLDPAYLNEAYRPLLLWDNRVTIDTIAADHGDASYPATNLANPQTSALRKWKSGSTADQYLTVTSESGEEIDGFGFVGHNFGSAQIPVTVEGITAEPGADWEVLQELAPASDKPLMGLVTSGHYVGVRFFLEPGSVAPEAAVLYVGKALRLIRGIPPGHVPLTDARETETLGRSAITGDFLGDDIIVSQRLSTSMDLSGLDPDWYRQYLRPIVQSNAPGFLAWSPLQHPDECGFVKFASDPKPTVAETTGEIDISLPLIGIAL